MFELFAWNNLEYFHIATGRFEDIISLHLTLEEHGVTSHYKEVV